MNKKATNKGLTLLELVWVSSIIIIIAIIVLSIYLDAKREERDAERIKTVNSLQKTLNLYFEQNGYYPAGNEENLKTLLGQEITDIKYQSAYENSACSENCPSYHLGIKLEKMNNEVLFNDEDSKIGFQGFSIDCKENIGTYDYCYDVRP